MGEKGLAMDRIMVSEKVP